MHSRTGCGAVALACALASATTLVVALATAAPAHACGGFFCNLSQPVDQQDEEIVFVDNGDGTTTMAVRVFYAGPAEKFAWLLPVQGVPAVDVSSEQAFDALRQRTEPRYELMERHEGECLVEDYYDDDAGSDDGPILDGGSAEPPRVTLLDQGEVGPFEYSTIAVDGSAPDAADVAVAWLTDNDYDVGALGADVLRPYLADGLNLIAFKLQKGEPTGAIRPIVLDLPGDRPSIPIRPTAVAARPDMGVLVWVLGEERAVPINYKSLVLNEARIDWFNWRRNYDEVISAAADEAGGQGFVTELAARDDSYARTVYPQEQRDRFEQFLGRSFASGLEALEEARWVFFGMDGWQQVVCGSLTLSPGYTCADWAAIDNDRSDPTRGSVTASVDAIKAALREQIVSPLEKMQALLDSRPYMTRLYTTLSPAEMTLDPVFAFNADLPEVGNRHVAEVIYECGDAELFEWEAPYRVVLPSGGVVRGEARRWPGSLGSLPANATISQLSTRGQGEVLEDNRDAIAAALGGEDAGDGNGSGDDFSVDGPPDGGAPDGGVPADAAIDGGASDAPRGKKGGGLCAVGRPGRGGAPLAGSALLLGLPWLVRRRMRRRA